MSRFVWILKNFAEFLIADHRIPKSLYILISSLQILHLDMFTGWTRQGI